MISTSTLIRSIEPPTSRACIVLTANDSYTSSLIDSRFYSIHSQVTCGQVEKSNEPKKLENQGIFHATSYLVVQMKVSSTSPRRQQSIDPLIHPSIPASQPASRPAQTDKQKQYSGAPYHHAVTAKNAYPSNDHRYTQLKTKSSQKHRHLIEPRPPIPLDILHLLPPTARGRAIYHTCGFTTAGISRHSGRLPDRIELRIIEIIEFVDSTASVALDGFVGETRGWW